MKLLLLGLPASGKGAQAQLLHERFSIPAISMGDLLRVIAKEDSELGKTVKETLRKGELLPNGLTSPIIRRRLAEADCREGFVVDGYPRTMEQAEELDGMLAELGHRLDHVVYLKAREEVILHRITGRRVCPECSATYHIADRPPAKEGRCDRCGAELIRRSDDEPATVRRRLEVQKPALQRLTAYYRRKGHLREVDGNEEAERVFREIRALVSGVSRFMTIRLNERQRRSQKNG